MKARRRFGALKRRLQRLEGERCDELVTELLLDDGTTVILRGRDADPARVVRGVLGIQIPIQKQPRALI